MPVQGQEQEQEEEQGQEEEEQQGQIEAQTHAGAALPHCTPGMWCVLRQYENLSHVRTSRVLTCPPHITYSPTPSHHTSPHTLQARGQRGTALLVGRGRSSDSTAKWHCCSERARLRPCFTPRAACFLETSRGRGAFWFQFTCVLFYSEKTAVTKAKAKAKEKETHTHSHIPPPSYTYHVSLLGY